MNVMDGGLFGEGFSGEGESERCLGVHQPTGGKRTQKLGRRVVTGKEDRKDLGREKEQETVAPRGGRGRRRPPCHFPPGPLPW